MLTPEQLDVILGPLGLTVAAIVAVIAFWREWVVPGSRVKRLEALVERFATLSEASNLATSKMASALEERNELDEKLLKRIGERK